MRRDLGQSWLGPGESFWRRQTWKESGGFDEAAWKEMEEQSSNH